MNHKLVKQTNIGHYKGITQNDNHAKVHATIDGAKVRRDNLFKITLCNNEAKVYCANGFKHATMYLWGFIMLWNILKPTLCINEAKVCCANIFKHENIYLWGCRKLSQHIQSYTM